MVDPPPPIPKSQSRLPQTIHEGEELECVYLINELLGGVTLGLSEPFI